MSTHTKADRRADLRSLAADYNVPVKLSEGDLDLCNDIGKYGVFPLFFEEYDHLFKVTNVTFAHADAWPTNFFGLAGRQYKAGSPNVRIRYAPVEDIPMLTRNARIAGSTTQPVLFVADQKFYFLPSSMTGVTIEHYLYPTQLADVGTVDTATDTMPEVSEPLITRAAFEVMLKWQVDQQTALELNKVEIEQTETALRQVFAEKYKLINKEPQLS